MAEPHGDRIARITTGFDRAMERFLERLSRAGARGEAAPGEGQWSAAQIAWHVALVNETFAGLIAGSVKGPAPAAADFVEADWESVRSRVPPKLEASPRVQPPGGVAMAAAIEKLRASAEAVRAALASLTPERGLGYTLKTSIVGEISVYQIGDWATAHVIRHNAQAKHVLGG
jgi:hypothetical protein